LLQYNKYYKGVFFLVLMSDKDQDRVLLSEIVANSEYLERSPEDLTTPNLVIALNELHCVKGRVEGYFQALRDQVNLTIRATKVMRERYLAFDKVINLYYAELSKRLGQAGINGD